MRDGVEDLAKGVAGVGAEQRKGSKRASKRVTFSQKRSSGHRGGGASKGRGEPVPKTSWRREPSIGVGGTV